MTSPRSNTADLQEDAGFTGQSPSISRVAVKIPPFWDADPQMWFVNIEAQFVLAQIVADETKYNYVVSSLDPKYWTEVRDILSNPPPTGRYDKLKSELIRRMSATQHQKTRRLLEHEEIGDRKPSQFLRHLRALAGTVIPDEVLRPLWCDRLPTFTKAILASQKQKTLDELADLADAIADANPQSRIEQTTSTTLPLQAMYQQMTAMNTALCEVTATLKQIAEMRARGEPRYGAAKRNRSKSRTRSEQHNGGLCWYHAKFRDNSKKCRSPCSYTSGNGTARH